MNDIWVVNASPLIVLAKIARLDLLLSSDHGVVIPQAVADEVGRGTKDDPARLALLGKWGGSPLSVQADPLVLEWGLGEGETAVLSMARQTGAIAVIDDGAARAAAKVLGIRHIGTLGVILRAQLAGKIGSAAAILRELRENGMRLDDQVIREALRQTTGESWCLE